MDNKKVVLKDNIYDSHFNPNGTLFAPIEIIVPYHGDYNKVTNLVTGILQTVKKNNFKITLIDDCSKNVNFGVNLQKVGGVSVIRNEVKKGHLESLNVGIQQSALPYVCGIRSDVVVSGDWLNKMLVTLNKNDLSMVSPLTDNPGNFEYLKSNKTTAKKDLELLEGQHLPLYCFLAKKQLFDKVGYFKEDAQEFAERMKVAGYKQVVSGASWVSIKSI